MTDWLDLARVALDTSPGVVPFFFRDDDVGWDDDALWHLLDRVDKHGVHIDLAVIPGDLGGILASGLRDRAASGLVHLHQHGFRHLNHETGGRKFEFGPSRAYDAQHADIATGRKLLDDQLDRCLEPIFTPPWNRCTEVTAAVLVDLEFEVLSRDHSAGRFGLDGLCEVPVTVDWFAKGKCGPVSRDELGALVAHRIVGWRGPVGVMLHHGVTDPEQLELIDELFALVAGHPLAVSTSIYNWSL